MSFENLGEPVTFVRSPTFTKFVSGRMVSASSPLNLVNPPDAGSAARAASGEFVSPPPLCGLTSLGFKPFTASANTLICAGVVPQQPPTKFNHPFSTHSFNCGASDSAVSGNPVGNN